MLEAERVPGAGTGAEGAHDARASDGHVGVFASVGAVGAALLSALCCVGPLLFVAFGVGAGLASTFEPFRPFLTFLTFALLGLGFWTVYGRPLATRKAGVKTESGASCGPEAHCHVSRSRRREKVILWGATAATVTFWSFPYWSTLLL